MGACPCSQEAEPPLEPQLAHDPGGESDENKLIQREKAAVMYGLELPTHATFAGGTEHHDDDIDGQTCTMTVRLGSGKGCEVKQMRMRLDEAGGSIKVRLYEQSVKATDATPC